MKSPKCKYCCDRFSIYHQAYKRSFPNIRIVKYKSKFLIDNPLDNEKFNSPYRFWITTGYEKFNLDNVMINIAYCPFCGEDLFRFYKDDRYANEIEGKTFFLVE